MHHRSMSRALLTMLIALGMSAGMANALTNTSISNGDWQVDANWSQGHVPASGEDVVVAHNLTNGVSTPVLASVAVVTNKTLTFSGWNTILTATNVYVTGTVTHVACTTNNAPVTNRVYIVCTNLTLAGTIDVIGRGFQGGQASGLTDGQGPGGGLTGTPGGGGGYGGEGSDKAAGGRSGVYGQTYGSATYPLGPGSGGGRGDSRGGSGNGGGSVWIEASGTAVVNGTIRANGGAATTGWSGGGSGGAVFLAAGSLSGSGTLEAKGGNGNYVAGGAGGGRIHVVASLGHELAASVTGGANGGQPTSWPAGSNGTYVFTTLNPDLTVCGLPANHGSPTPYAHGVAAIAAGTWVTNAVNSPADTANGTRYACLGWTLTTNGVAVDSGTSTQAVFQMLATNTVLTYLWTNEYELAVAYATNGTATVASNGWYIKGATVAGLQATPDSNYEFLQWSGDITSSQCTNNPLTLTLDQRRWITAHFGSTTTATNRTFAGGDWFAWTNWTPKGIPGRLDTARLTNGNTTLVLPITVSGLVVGVTATNTLTGWDTALRVTDMIVSGKVTHTACTTNNGPTNRVYILTSNLSVPGAIDVSGKGYQGGIKALPTGQGSGGGQSGDPAGCGGYGGEGTCKSAGGRSGSYGQTYGSAAFPIGPGSGGGFEPGQAVAGGPGGGSVWIEASGSVTIDGAIGANGGVSPGYPASGHAGGGSGGAVYLYAVNLGGVGTIEAKGGQGTWTAGGGGGGRIAVSFMTGTEVARNLAGGANGGQPTAWPAGSNGTYSLTLLGQALSVEASPTNHGTPVPYGYGAASLLPGSWITNSVGSPADETNGVRYACIGWTLATNGVYAAAGASTQAVFQMVAGVTNTTLTYLWTNVYQLTVSAATNGSATTDSNGWYLAGTPVTALQATPDAGFQFYQWWGDVPDGSAYSNVLDLTMDRARTVTAHFVDPFNGTNRTRSVGGKWFDWQSWSPRGVPGPKDSVVLTGGTALMDYPVTLASLTITNATLSFTNWNTTLTLTGDLTILNNGTATHVTCYRFPTDMSNRVCITARNVTIDGTINVNAKGYYRGRLPGWGPSTDGQGPGRGVYSASSGSGGGYGGAGGRCDGTTGGLTYGSATNPIGPGSGGAYGQPHRPEGGGNGGGTVRLEASDAVTLNGTIVANGSDADADWGGGGSGGAIWITCRRFVGPAGTHLTARGGGTASGGGGGGGGRIAIAYSGSFQYQGTNSVAGGTNTAKGAAYQGSSGTYVQVDNSIKGSNFIFR